MTDRIDISKDLNKNFFQDKSIHKGKVLGFQQDGELNHYKIVRLNRSKKICIVEPIDLYDDQDIRDMSPEDLDNLVNKGNKDGSS